MHANDGWRLTVVVEDEAGPRIPEAGTAMEGEQEIDLGTFYREFIQPDRGAQPSSRRWKALKANRVSPD
jgi:hypothetical protein